MKGAQMACGLAAAGLGTHRKARRSLTSVPADGTSFQGPWVHLCHTHLCHTQIKTAPAPCLCSGQRMIYPSKKQILGNTSWSMLSLKRLPLVLVLF